MTSPHAIPLNDLKRHNASVAAELAVAVARVTASGWYIGGQELKAFESAFARYSGTAHCIGVANGTDALELALRAAGVRAGDEVLTVANAGMYSSTAILAVGARPVYVDIVPETLLMDTGCLGSTAGPGARAVVATHLYGRMLDMEQITRVAQRSGLTVIEDCAQAHGASRNGRRAGGHGAIGCFSFYPTKNLGALGDAGALVTDDDGLTAGLRALRQYGWTSKYLAGIAGGRNSRLDELQAAVLTAKLPHLERWNSRRREIARRYTEGIVHNDICTPPHAGSAFVAHLYVVRTPRRDALRAHLARRGVGTDIHYPVPDHLQPPFARAGAPPALPVTEAAAREVLSLPCFPEMTDDEVDRVVTACNTWEA